jgi:hypothetical protein
MPLANIRTDVVVSPGRTVVSSILTISAICPARDTIQAGNRNQINAQALVDRKPHCTSIAASFRRVPCAGGRLRQGCERGRPRSGYAAGFGRSSESGFAGAGRVYIARPFILSAF